METRNSLQLKEVRKSFRRKEILHGISCDLENGVYGLLGTNGAGKTTLMRCMTGYYQYKGDIILNESNVRKMGLRKIGYLPQKFVGYPELSVYQMLEYFVCCSILRKSSLYFETFSPFGTFSRSRREHITRTPSMFLSTR